MELLNYTQSWTPISSIMPFEGSKEVLSLFLTSFTPFNHLSLLLRDFLASFCIGEILFELLQQFPVLYVALGLILHEEQTETDNQVKD